MGGNSEKQNVLKFLLPFICPKPKFGALYLPAGLNFVIKKGYTTK